MAAQPTDRPKDKVLTVTRVLLQIMQGFMIFGCVIITLVLPVLWIKRADVLAELAKNMAPAVPGTESLIAISIIMLGGLAMLAIGFAFIKRIIAIIDTVMIDTPFVPVNARRLREMGWLVIATQGLALLVLPFAVWIEAQLPKGNDLGIEVSVEALLTAMLLFILARVFDHGTRLAEDVEGTV